MLYLLARNPCVAFEPGSMTSSEIIESFNFPGELSQLWSQAKVETEQVRAAIRARADENFLKVFAAFRASRLSEAILAGTTGYGYDDGGRESLDKLFAHVFGAESAAVRIQWVSGTHAIVAGLRGNLLPGQTLLAATGAPYDTLLPAIGYPKDYPGSLRSFGIEYQEVPLREGKPDLSAIESALTPETGVVFLQRSRGYTWRPSLSVGDLAKIIELVRKKTNHQTTIIVDNCYGEMVEESEPTNFGADLVIGSLIKNLGATIVPTGAYVAGSAQAVENTMTAFTAPGLGSHVGPSLGLARTLAQGLSLAPQMVGQCLEGLVVASWLFEKRGYETSPGWSDFRTDTIQAIRLGSIAKQRAFCKAIQELGLVDSSATPISVVQPGYRDPILMAGGTFIQGSSAELSADGPEREPHVCYLQGGTSRVHVELAALNALRALEEVDRL